MRITLSTISFFLSMNFTMGQSIQTIIDKLLKYQVLDKGNKEEMKQFLIRQQDTSNSIILGGLYYLEMMKLATNNSFSNIVALPEHTKDQQDSANKELFKYLTAVNSAGLIASPVYTECKANIDQNLYQIKYQLITDLSQKTQLLELLAQTSLSTEKKNSLSLKEIEDAIISWRNIGLFDHLTKEQIELSKSKAIEDSSETLNEVLSHFSSVIHSFDTELENLKDPYAELIKELSNISHNIFTPTNITDNFQHPSNHKASVEFTLNNKNYSTNVQIEDDWIDASFFNFIKQVVDENKLGGQFYELYEGGQGSYIIFLTPKQYEFIKQNKLLVFPED